MGICGSEYLLLEKNQNYAESSSWGLVRWLSGQVRTAKPDDRSLFPGTYWWKAEPTQPSSSLIARYAHARSPTHAHACVRVRVCACVCTHTHTKLGTVVCACL